MTQSARLLVGEFRLTQGGLVRTLKLGRPEHTLHLWWPAARAEGDAPPPSDGDVPMHLVEIELVDLDKDTATVRIWAPDHVRIISAKKDPRRLAVAATSPPRAVRSPRQQEAHRPGRREACPAAARREERTADRAVG